MKDTNEITIEILNYFCDVSLLDGSELFVYNYANICQLQDSTKENKCNVVFDDTEIRLDLYFWIENEDLMCQFENNDYDDEKDLENINFNVINLTKIYKEERERI